MRRTPDASPSSPLAPTDGKPMRRGNLRDHSSRDLSFLSPDWLHPLVRSRGVCPCPDRRHVLFWGFDDCALKLWDLDSGHCLRTFSGHTDEVKSVCLSADGRHALSGSSDQTVKLWDLANGQCLRSFDGHGNGVDLLCLSSDGIYALSTKFNRWPEPDTFRLWDVVSGKCVRSIATLMRSVSSVCLTADNRHALSSGDERVILWDLASGKDSRIFKGHTASVNSVCPSSDGRHALSGSSDRTLKYWDLATGKCLRTFTGHTESVWSVCLSVDGRHALSGSSDKTLKVWDVVSSQCLRTFTGHSDWVASVHLSATGKYAISRGFDGAKLWTLDWELEETGTADWDEGARPYLEVFVRAQQPYAAPLPQDRAPTDEEITRALARGGTPVWTEADFQRLLHTLGCAGYGWLRPDGVRRELDRMAKAMALGTAT